MSRRTPTLISYAVVALGSALVTYVVVPTPGTPDGYAAQSTQTPPARPTRDVARPTASDISEITREAAMIDRVLEVAEEVDPAMADHLREICDADPQEFDRVMRQSGQRLLGLVRLKEADPQLYHAKVQELRFERQAIDLAVRHCRAVKAGNMGVAEEMELRLHSLLQTQMALKLKVRGDSINRLKEHVGRLELDLEVDAGKFSEVVQQRLDSLLKRDDSGDCESVIAARSK